LQQEANVNEIIEAQNARAFEKNRENKPDSVRGRDEAQNKVTSQKVDELSPLTRLVFLVPPVTPTRVPQPRGGPIQQVKDRLEREANERIKPKQRLCGRKAKEEGENGTRSELQRGLGEAIKCEEKMENMPDSDRKPR
jgi:hypothetical protein